ncbi:hypothetical protein D9757_006019 [Collybiopsis confluens]|uniref:Protein kinase domain-containing protein n=1 Tax=Collybiopsis confluens TaxID=2823264 RepID=A0A8H5HUV3_9AGAR|nr:hypothetical protein D9757_006019 [Collybiopsis confluens]
MREELKESRRIYTWPLSRRKLSPVDLLLFRLQSESPPRPLPIPSLIMSYFTKGLLVLVLTIILAVHAAPYSAVNHRHVRIIVNAVRSNNNQVQVFNTSIQHEPGRLGGRTNYPTWLLSEFKDQLTDADKKAFGECFLTQPRRVTITAAAINNGGIWNVKTYKGYSGSPGDLLLKVLNPVESDPRAWDYNYGEVKALKQVGDFVASGYIKDPGLSTLDKMKSKIKSKPPSDFRVVIMKKKDGKTLKDIRKQMQWNTSQWEALARPVKELACKAAAEIAVNKQVLHGDINPGNVLITMDQQTPESVNIVDWGKGNWVSKGVKKDEVYQYCMQRPYYPHLGFRRGEIADSGASESGF